jgi:hypothetical protein
VAIIRLVSPARPVSPVTRRRLSLEMPHPGPPGAEGRPPPPFAQQGAVGGGRLGDLLEIQPRLAILDRSGQVLGGHPRSGAVTAKRPIQFQGQTVGWLSLQAPRAGAARDAAFLATQTHTSIGID